MIVTLDRALLCLQHRVESGQALEDACYDVAVACKVGYDELLQAYKAAPPLVLFRTRIVAGYGWPFAPTNLH